MKERPSAIFCVTDRLALQIMQSAKEIGVKIPEELSVVGFDDIAQAATCEIPLSTVQVPYYSLGETAVKLLFEKLKSRQDIYSKNVMTRFIVRKSVGVFKK